MSKVQRATNTGSPVSHCRPWKSKTAHSNMTLCTDNLRYSFDYCVYGFPNGTGSGSNPCVTSTACGALRPGLEDGDLSTTGSQFGYCDDGAVTGEFYSACLTCVGSSGDTRYIANGKSNKTPSTAARMLIRHSPRRLASRLPAEAKCHKQTGSQRFGILSHDC